MMTICPKTPKLSLCNISQAILSFSEWAGRVKSMPNISPLPRTAETKGQVSAMGLSFCRTYSPMAAAFSTRWSSSMT